MATDILFPEWEIWTQFLLEINGGLSQDAQEQSHPIEVGVEQISGENEDLIIYQDHCILYTIIEDRITYGNHPYTPPQVGSYIT